MSVGRVKCEEEVRGVRGLSVGRVKGGGERRGVKGGSRIKRLAMGGNESAPRGEGRRNRI